ncbi:MAG TPA: helix-turn-helix transcriptional regulator [Thermoanaerobaculia bacterium]|nr:helix-turn-helix transcriptional regulator [Thermoanaerobaculia bacterium]
MSPRSTSRANRRPPRATEALKPKQLQILLALADQDRHGLDIVREVRRSTEGAMRLWPGALYGALDELAARGWIHQVEPPPDATRDGNPRFFQLTPAGRETLTTEVRRLERLLDDARSRIAAKRT